MKDVHASVETLYPGVTQLQFGPAAGPTLLDFAGVSPRADALTTLGEGVLPMDPAEIRGYRSSGRMVISVPLDSDEKLYGFGLQYHGVEHRGQLFELRVDHYKGKDDGRTHAPVPFCISSKGYGLFINAAAKMWVYAGRTHRKERHPEIRTRRDKDWRAVAVSEIMEIALAEEGVEVLLFSGLEMQDVVRRFNLYCGGGCLPPKWGLGFWHRTPLQYTADQVLEEIDEYDAAGFPLDVIGLEPGWHSSSYPTTCEWHPVAFPNPERFVSECAKNGVRINLWENCFIHPTSTLGCAVEPFSGSHTGSWGGYCPDLSMSETREVIASHHIEHHVSLGVSGYKLDECDDDNWIFPDYAEFPSGISGEKLHQVYGTLFQRTAYEMFRSRGRRTYSLVRASNAGASSFPFVIYNDCYDHREYIAGMCSGSLAGVLFTPEARDAKTSEEWLRRIQATCFSPLAQLDAWASGTKPWDYGDVTDHVRETVMWRIKLIPYLYSAFAGYYTEGTPPFRAMVLETQQDGATGYVQGELHGTHNPYSLNSQSDMSDQYMIGPSLLVAPLFAGEEGRSVLLPPGKWYDFYTGEYVGKNATIEVSSSHMQIPLYVRNGGIIPMYDTEYTRVPGAKSDVGIIIRHYGDAPGKYELYDDDGETYDYEDGICARWILEAVPTAGQMVGTVTQIENSFVSPYTQFMWQFMTSPEHT